MRLRRRRGPEPQSASPGLTGKERNVGFNLIEAASLVTDAWRRLVSPLHLSPKRRI